MVVAKTIKFKTKLPKSKITSTQIPKTKITKTQVKGINIDKVNLKNDIKLKKLVDKKLLQRAKLESKMFKKMVVD